MTVRTMSSVSAAEISRRPRLRWVVVADDAVDDVHVVTKLNTTATAICGCVIGSDDDARPLDKRHQIGRAAVNMQVLPDISLSVIYM